MSCAGLFVRLRAAVDRLEEGMMGGGEREKSLSSNTANWVDDRRNMA